MKTTTVNTPKTYKEITVLDEATIKTGHPILDRILSRKHGFVIGSAIFLTGTSGAGKTTLIATLQKLLENIKSSFYSREMSASAVKEQTDRLKINHENAFISDVDDYENLDEYIKMLDILKPKVVMVDSLQVIVNEDYGGQGDQGEFEVIQKLRKWTEKNQAVLIVIGHVTKDGEFRGNNTIMQLFDAHFEMIHDKKKDFRTFSQGHKNRKGGSNETAYYDFSDNGIVFFTQEEWEVRREKKTLDDFLFESVSNFLNGIDKTQSSYIEFKKEFNKRWNEFKGTKSEMVMFYLELTKELIKKYKI